MCEGSSRPTVVRRSDQGSIEASAVGVKGCVPNIPRYVGGCVSGVVLRLSPKWLIPRHFVVVCVGANRVFAYWYMVGALMCGCQIHTSRGKGCPTNLLSCARKWVVEEIGPTTDCQLLGVEVNSYGG